jgi:hypothetical protein
MDIRLFSVSGIRQVKSDIRLDIRPVKSGVRPDIRRVKSSIRPDTVYKKGRIRYPLIPYQFMFCNLMINQGTASLRLRNTGSLWWKTIPSHRKLSRIAMRISGNGNWTAGSVFNSKPLRPLPYPFSASACTGSGILNFFPSQSFF